MHAPRKQSQTALLVVLVFASLFGSLLVFAGPAALSAWLNREAIREPAAERDREREPREAREDVGRSEPPRDSAPAPAPTAVTAGGSAAAAPAQAPTAAADGPSVAGGPTARAGTSGQPAAPQPASAPAAPRPKPKHAANPCNCAPADLTCSMNCSLRRQQAAPPGTWSPRVGDPGF